ncbi:MAG: hypothetical protein HXX81_03500 [Campylobacterales bacterium]|nr:hypothetical protein [Campylobacterales bacterium]
MDSLQSATNMVENNYLKQNIDLIDYTTPKSQDNFFKIIIPLNTCYPMPHFEL